MSDLLTIGSSGVNAYQRSLATVSNNIANVNTEGYTRQDVTIAANQPRLLGSNYIGTGVRFDAVRRQYDAFVESNLRNSQSDLKAQEPLLSYVNRLIDVMGDESIGLTTAMNLFFESARDLATDPASTIQRSIFMRDADGLAARFRQLASQFDLLSNETRQAIDTDLGQVNSLTNQLALLNKQLSKHSLESEQPSELLDQRDLLLRQLSSLIAIKTSFAPNGSVLVSVGDTLDQGILVRDDRARAISVTASATDPGKLQFTIDAYGNPEGLAALSSGKLGGVMNFREQVLNPAASALDDLASVMVREVNTVHREGVDAEGKLGGDLYAFAADRSNKAAGVTMVIQDATRVAAAGQFRVIDDPLNSGTAQARISYSTPVYDGPGSLQGDLAIGLAPQAGLASLKIQAGIGYTHVGAVTTGTQNLALSLLDPSPTQQLQVFTRDGRHLIGSSNLSSTLQSSLVQSANGMEKGATYNSSLLNAGGQVRHVDGVLTVQALPGQAAPAKLLAGPFPEDAIAPPDGIPQGTFVLNGVSLPEFKAGGGRISLNEVVAWINTSQASLPATSQVVALATADGRLQLSRPASNTVNGIELKLGPNPGSQSLTLLGFASNITQQTADPVPADLAFLAGGLFPSPATLGDIAADALRIDGYSLPALSLQGGGLTLEKAVDWINGAGIPGINALAIDGRLQLERSDNDRSKSLSLSVGPQGQPQMLERLGMSTAPRYLEMDIFLGAMAPVGQTVSFNSITGSLLPPVATPAVLQSRPLSADWVLASPLPAGTLTLNGIPMPALAQNSTLAQVAQAFNDSQQGLPPNSRIEAILRKVEVRVGNNLQTLQQLELRRSADNTSQDIRLGLGPNGKPADLQALGFTATLHVQGGSTDDLLVFVTDSSGADSFVNLQSSMTGQSGSLKQVLRDRPLELRFVSDQHYEIIDTRTQSVLAQRQLQPLANAATPSIEYRGLKLEFSTLPRSGDRFMIDGNSDGIGNNEAMLKLVELENARIMPGGLTLTEAYIERVNQVGNVSRQAAIAQQALTVVYEQAQEARDGISGVSLDEEASALVRLQQAYQANAKVMQTSMTLFEAILQVR